MPRKPLLLVNPRAGGDRVVDFSGNGASRIAGAALPILREAKPGRAKDRTVENAEKDNSDDGLLLFAVSSASSE